MNDIGHDAAETQRLTLALLLALGLHAALLLGIPTNDWSFHHARPSRLNVAILPPMERPIPPAAAPVPAESAIQSGPTATAPVSEPTPPLPEPPPLPSPPPIPVPTPLPSPTPPPRPVIVTKPAPKAAAPVPKPAPAAPPKPTKASVPPVKPAKPAVSSVKPASPPPRTAMATPSDKSPLIKPPPAPRLPPLERLPSPETPRPPRIGRSERGTGVGTSAPSRRLDSTALLGQIAGLDAENQRRISNNAREQRVNLADTYSLAGFYAADWARKVTRVGEMNFPDAARRSSPGTGPLLEVAIQADGRLRGVRVLRSSGNAELDQAARRIVELAAPYPSFPAELRRQIEVLRIEAPWRFDPGGRVRVR